MEEKKEILLLLKNLKYQKESLKAQMKLGIIDSSGAGQELKMISKKDFEKAKKGFENIGNKYFGGIADTYKGTKAGDGFWNSLEAAHKNTDGTYRWDRIAGTYAAAAVGSRVLSGGGLYKDKYGNTNLPGVPFI